MGRAPCCEKVGLKKGRWTAEEDEKLAKYIQANGEGSWRSLPKNAGLLRCGKSCRLRWINYLRADLKRGNISVEEENTIVKLHASFGNRWSMIASHLAGRTDNEIKNYWNSHLSRKIYSFTRVETEAGAGVMDSPKVTPIPIPPKRKGGRTSRWAMKKNKKYAQNDTRRPKQSFAQQIADAAVPSLESEGPSNADVAEVREERLDGAEQSAYDDILGQCELEGINEVSGALESCLAETCGAWNLSEERESNEVVGVGGEDGRNKTASSGEWDSCSPMSLGFDQNWDWESVVEFNNVDDSEAYNWEHQENLLTTLWEDDDWESDTKKSGETDPQLQNDMLAWLLS